MADGDAESARDASDISAWERNTGVTTGRQTTRDTTHTHGTMHSRDTHMTAYSRETTGTRDTVRSQSPPANRAYRGYSVAETLKEFEANIYGDVFTTAEDLEGKIKEQEDKFFNMARRAGGDGLDGRGKGSFELERDSDFESVNGSFDFSGEDIELGCNFSMCDPICRHRCVRYTYIVLRRSFKWVLPIMGLTIFILFMASLLFAKYERGTSNWTYILVVCIMEPAGCLCTILPWMRVHPPGKESTVPRQKNGRRQSLLRRADHRYFRATGLHRRTATTIILLLTVLKLLAVSSQPQGVVYLFQPGEIPESLDGELVMGVHPRLMSLLYVTANQILLFVYIPWLHRHLFEQSLMTYIAKTLPFASILTTTVELFAADVRVVKAVDGVIYGFYGVVWLAEILRSCGKPTTKNVSFFSTMLWINQMLPNAAGRVMYVLLIESELPVLLIAVFYWTFSAIFLQFMKRAANCATASRTAEAFVFQLQHTADLFFVLLYINTSFPGTTFFLLLVWNFVQVVFRDGDFIGMIQEVLRSDRCLNCKPGDVSETRQNMRGTWRLLTIQNAMSERVAWMAAFCCVVFELAMSIFSDGVFNDVITACLASESDKTNAAIGYIIIGVTLLASQRVVVKIWNMRLLRTAKWAELGVPMDSVNGFGDAGGGLSKTRNDSGGLELNDIDQKAKHHDASVSFTHTNGNGVVPRASSPQLDASGRTGFRDDRLSTISGSVRSESVESSATHGRDTRGLSGLSLAKDRLSSIGREPSIGEEVEVVQSTSNSLHSRFEEPGVIDRETMMTASGSFSTDEGGRESARPNLCPLPSGSSSDGTQSQHCFEPPPLCPAPSGSSGNLSARAGSGNGTASIKDEMASMSSGSGKSGSPGAGSGLGTGSGSDSGLRSGGSAMGLSLRGGSGMGSLMTRSTRAESVGKQEIVDLLGLFDSANFNPHASHRQYMKTFDVYFRAVIVYVMCSAFMGIANILAKKGCHDE